MMGHPSRFDTLQALRALAACTVAFFHTVDFASRYTHDMPGWFGKMNFIGPAGVDLFFVISGFVMFYTTRDLPRSGASVRRFMLRRILRIVPLYWLLTTVMVALLLLLPQAFNRLTIYPLHALASYFFIPMYNSAGEPFPVLGLGWSLNYEMYFYVVMACLLLTRRRLLWLALFFVPCVLYGYLCPPETLAYQMITGPQLLEFVMGGAAAEYIRLHSSGKPHMAAMVGVGVLAFGVAHFHTLDPLRVVPIGLGASLIVFGLAAMENQRRARVPQWLVALGDASYAIYLGHIFVLAPFFKLWEKTVGPQGGAWVIFIAFPLAVTAAYFLYRWVEKPLGAWLNGKLTNHGADAARILGSQAAKI